jgi:hypothetical protein
MSRNHVSKVLVGAGLANVGVASTSGGVLLATLTEGQIIAFDYDRANDAVDGGVGSTGNSIMPATKNIGFARGTAVLGEALIAGPIPVSGISSAVENPYEALRTQKKTLTVGTVPVAGETVIVRVAYRDNLSIVPNQIKQTIIGVQANAANVASTTTWATAIKDAFNLQTAELGGNLFVDVTSSAAIITFESQILTTQSNYNGIDRPEALSFEVGYPETGQDQGEYTLAETQTLRHGQGDPAKIAWMEEQSMGRFGFSDRRQWFNTKKYPLQVDNSKTYATVVLNADIEVEGDLQGVRSNPIGAVVAAEVATVGVLKTDLARAGVVPELIAAS